MLNQLMRYQPIVNLVKKEGIKKILDVGSGTKGMNIYLPEAFVIGLDISFRSTKNIVRDNFNPINGSAKQLPFRDNSFPIVVCNDTLEHIPFKYREIVIKEMWRVTKSKVYLSFPIAETHEKWEKRIIKTYEYLGKDKPGWLLEHIKEGLPREKDITNLLKKNNVPFMAIPNENNFIHFIIMLIEISWFSKYFTGVSEIISPETWKWRKHSFKANIIRILFIHAKRVLRYFDFGSPVRKIFVLTKNVSNY